LPEPRLLDAAHSVADADEQLGQPIVSTELPLSKIHHAAFDANLVGIDPNSERLLDLDDGPSPEQGLKAMAGGLIGLPRRTEDYPDKERLELRFGAVQKIGLMRRDEIRAAPFLSSNCA
jgi:putative restriction endonuclease